MLLGMQVCIIKIIHYCLGCYFGDQHGGQHSCDLRMRTRGKCCEWCASEMFWEWSKRPNEAPK